MNKILAIITIILMIAFACFALTGCSEYPEEEKVPRDVAEWNNGVCLECGGNYKFSGAVATNANMYYCYTCDKCDHTIMVNTIMK